MIKHLRNANGQKTLNENIADLGGAQLAFQALTNKLKADGLSAEAVKQSEFGNNKNKRMKRVKFMMILMAAVLTMGVVSCSDAEDGESWDAWVIRNQLNSNWSLDFIKVNDEYRRLGDEGFDFYLTLKLKADGRKFEAERFFYNKEESIVDESTRVNKTGTFTIDASSKTIELIDSQGNKFMRLSNIDFGTGSMTATVLFYDLNQTYNIGLNRTISF